MEQKVLDESKIRETTLNMGPELVSRPRITRPRGGPSLVRTCRRPPLSDLLTKASFSVLAQIITADSAALLRFLLTPLHYRESSADALYNYTALTSVQAFLVPLHVRLVRSTRSRPHRHRLDPPAESSTFFLLSPSPFFASRLSRLPSNQKSACALRGGKEEMALHEKSNTEEPIQASRHVVDDMTVSEKFSAPAREPSPEAQPDGSSDTVGRARSSSDNQLSTDATETNDDVAAAKDTSEGGDGNPLDRVPSQAQKLGGKKIAVVMGALCLVLFLAALDMTIISTALPTMAADFNASESGYSWMASSFSLTNAAFVPLWGKLSDIWGRKPILLLANFAFLIGSLICALAKNLPMVLAGRAIQGAGAGGIITLANICVSDLFSVRERPMYYALFGTTWAIAGALGPLVGGAFTTSVTWRWCFWLNLPIGGVSFAILFFFLKIESPKTPLLGGLKTIDWSGVLLIVGGTLMFLFGLQFGGVNYPWGSATVICLIVFGLFTYVLAMLNEWKIARYPVIPLRLFTNWHNVLILVICFMHSMVFMGGSYYLPFYFQSVLLVSPILSGVYVLPQVLSLSLMSIVTGILIRKTGRYRELIIAAFVFLTLGYGLLIDLKPYASWPRIIIYQLIGGFGTGPLFQAPLVALQANIHPSDMAAGTSTFSFLRQVSASISIVIGTVIYQNILVSKSSTISAAVGPETAAALSSSFAENSHELIRSLPEAQKDAVLDVFNFSLSRIWIFYTAMAGVGLIVSIFVTPVELSKTHTVRKTGLEEQERARKEILAEQARARGAKVEDNRKETV